MTLVFHPSALRDLRRIALWYRKHRLPPYEARFFERLRVTLRGIEQAPASWAILLDDIELRRARILRSPYAVHFIIRADHIRVVGVVHGARDPATWERRAREEPPE
jgi:plasmid stabilization system protein ParE